MVLVAPAILVQGPVEELADCHWTLPVEPVRVSVLVCPAQIGLGAALAVPATGGGDTTTVTDAVADWFEHKSW